MMNRQNRKSPFIFLQFYNLTGAPHVCHKISVTEHNGLGGTSCSRGKKQYFHFIRINDSINKLPGSVINQLLPLCHKSGPFVRFFILSVKIYFKLEFVVNFI